MAVKNLIAIAEESQIKAHRENFEIGDTVDVHIKIKEGDKERTQVFTGAVIGTKGTGLRRMFTVRRLVGSEGVERMFPLHSPVIERIEVRKKGKIRRAKLYYLRQRVGKATRLAERLKGAEGVDERPPLAEAVKPRMAGPKAATPKPEEPKAEK